MAERCILAAVLNALLSGVLLQFMPKILTPHLHPVSLQQALHILIRLPSNGLACLDVFKILLYVKLLTGPHSLVSTTTQPREYNRGATWKKK
jgi:hypothetical protein